ncbi:MAG: type restriction enzyme subunit [Methanolobus sp.]|nr:type restriction enzyme subunit [Methanolobus sp.]
MTGEWKECKLGDIVSSNKESIGKNYPFQTILYLDTGSITRGKIDSFQEYELSKAPSRAKRLVKNNVIVYSTVRPIQRHYGFIVNPQENLVVSTGFAVIEVKEHLAAPLFIFYFLTSDEIVETLDVIAEASTSAYPSLKSSDIEALDLLLPPLPEQKAIADLLSTWDEAIGKTERLIQAKENQFKWMLQGLTSKPQKDTEWEKVKLGEIGEIKKGKGITKDDLTERGIPCIRYAEIYTLYDFHVSEIQSCVTQKAFDSALKIEQGDVLFAASGETKEEIGKCIVYLGTKTACTGGDTLVFKAQLNLCDPMFMGFALNHPDVNRQKSSFAHGNSVVHLYGKDLANIYLILPPLEKQKQIAETLSTAQHEIDLLKQLAEKYKTQKRGLMQKMLTGEWRVKEEIVKNIER